MSLIAPLNLATSNIGTTVEVVILLITALACLIIAGKDIRIAALLYFFFTGLEWVWFLLYDGITEVYTMYIFFGSVIILALSLIVTVKPVSQGGFL